MAIFKTIAASSESLYKEKGSKFYGYAFRVDDLEAVKVQLQIVSEKHPSARHICYAYRIGMDGKEVYRANDDGEPSGTAGLPILGQMKSFEVTNCLIAVVRYFGGTKLGASGLIHAYKTAAQACMELTKAIEVEEAQLLTISFDYADLGTILSVIDRNQLELYKSNYDGTPNVQIKVVKGKSAGIEALFERYASKIELADF